MKRFAKTMLGVTLLEIMLVLAIAAMVIIMSVRYYQSAQAGQQANQVIQQITAIMAAADSLSQSSGTYSGVSTTTVGGMLSNVGGLTTPWGDSISVTPGSTSYSVSIPNMPPAVCGIVWGQLNANKHVTGISTCGGTAANFEYTWNLNPT